MGWASGSELASEIWDAVKDHIPKKWKKQVAYEIIEAFEMHDCDTIDECEELCEAAGRVIDEETGDVVYV